MKYIQSFTEYESNFGGVNIPKGRYSASERDKGKKNIVAIEDSVYDKIKDGIVFNTMVNSGKLVIHDTLPEQYIDIKEKANILEIENKKLKADAISIESLQIKIRVLEEENLKLKSYIKKYKIETGNK